MAPKVALIAGVTGIIGMNLAKRVIKENWKVYGLSRRKPDYLPKVCKCKRFRMQTKTILRNVLCHA